MAVLWPGDRMSATGQRLDEEDAVNMSHDGKKRAFFYMSVGGAQVASVCL